MYEQNSADSRQPAEFFQIKDATWSLQLALWEWWTFGQKKGIVIRGQKSDLHGSEW